MRRTHLNVSLLLLVPALVFGCGDDDVGDAGEDATIDMRTQDADSEDADAEVEDAEVSDNSVPDADNSVPDADAEVDFGTAMSFFVSSEAPSSTGDLGGLDGADTHCRTLAAAAGAVRTQWFAYLSTDGDNPVNAIDRIGTGPWYNADEEVFAMDIASLHPTINPDDDRDGYIAVKPADSLFLDENGDNIAGPDHDILTGTQSDGTVSAGRTCNNWTSDAEDDSAVVGHSDTPNNERFSPSWNAAHNSAGCSEADLDRTGGAGFIYCFATD